MIFYIQFLNPTPWQWRFGIDCVTYSRITNTLVLLTLTLHSCRYDRFSNVSAYYQISVSTTQESTLLSTTIDLFFNWYLVSLSPRKMWPLLFTKVILYPNSVKLVRCSLSKKPTLLRRRHKVLHQLWLLVIRLTLMIFSITSLPTATLTMGRGTKPAIIMKGKNATTMVVVEVENGVPTKGVMQVVQVTTTIVEVGSD